MSEYSLLADQRSELANYTPAFSRYDRCGRCANSYANPCGELRCRLLMRKVASSAICDKWIDQRAATKAAAAA